MAQSEQVLSRLRGSPRVVMLDIDGTIAAIAPRPEAAFVPAETKRLVGELAARRGVVVVLVTGRSAHDAQRMVGARNVWIIGNHGLELMSPDGEVDVTPQVAAFEGAIKTVASTLERELVDVHGVVVEDKRWSLSVHYRLVDHALVPFIQNTVAQVAARHGMRVHEGKKVLEIRPRLMIDKGTAVLALARRVGAFDPRASLLYIGDDVTDEDAFRALQARLPAALTIRVAEEDGQSAAQYRIESLEDVRNLLAAVLEAAP